MNREKAEKLLAALIFDDLDEASKADLLTYLQTDDELRERLADMRMAVKVASDTLHHGPDPVLSKQRLKRLTRLTERRSVQPRVFTLRSLAAAAAIVVAASLPALVIFSSLNSARKHSPAFAVLEKAESDTSEFFYGRPLKVASQPMQSSGGDVYADGKYPFSLEDPAPKDSPAGPTIVAFDTFSGEDKAGKAVAMELSAQGKGMWYNTGAWRGTHGDDSHTAYVSDAEPPSASLTWESGPTTIDRQGQTFNYALPPDSTVALYNDRMAEIDGDNKSRLLGMSGSSFTTNGHNVLFQDGDMREVTLIDTGFASHGQPETGKPLLPAEPYLPSVTVQRETRGERIVTMDPQGPESPDQPRRHLTPGKDYGYSDDQRLDLGDEGEMPDLEKIRSLATAAYGTAKQHGRRDEVSILKSLKGAEESGLSPAGSDEKAALIIDRLGLPLGERESVDHDFEFDVAKKEVKSEKTQGNVPILGDVPTTGSLFLSHGAKEASAEEHTQREGQASAIIDYMKPKSEPEPKGSGMRPESKPDATAPASGFRVEGFYDGKAITGDEVGARTRSGPGGMMDNGRAGGDGGYGDLIKLKSGNYGGTIDLDDIESLTIVADSGSIRRPTTEPHVSGAAEVDGPEDELSSLETEYEIVNLRYADPREVKDLVGDGFRDLPGAQSLPKVLIEPLTENRQMILFGRKDAREMARKMIEKIDTPSGQATVEGTEEPGEEDGTDLPEAARFKLVPVNPWVMTERDPLSTFALDVDTASYTMCRRYIRGGFLPPPGAVRMEEFVNYFNYDYPQQPNPTFAVYAQAAPSPFTPEGQDLTLLKIGVKARTIGRDQRKAAHLIIVVDASASMDQPDRLPLVQKALGMLVDKLSPADRVSLITCANEARLHLEAASARQRENIREAIDAIQPAGPTNLLAGLKLGYATARAKFDPKQINHVVLCSDGVANVGQTEAEAVLKEVSADRKQGIAITCVGVGYGSYNDAFLEGLANRGDGSYVFLDSMRQARRVFVDQLAATLHTVAKDARIQVEFDPKQVRRYRLVGYENRDIEDKRFRDDTVDAGEVGSGQCSTALYELELTGGPSAGRQEDLGTVFVRYRNTDTGQIEEISERLNSTVVRRLTVESAPRFFLAAAAARFAEILRESEHAQNTGLKDVLRVAEQVSLALPLDRDVRGLAELINKADNLPKAP